MNWFGEALVNFATGFVRGAAQGYADRQTGRRWQPAHSGYDFGEHMMGLAQATGVQLVKLKPASATFRIELRGMQYPVILTWQGERISIGICSLITFPPGRHRRTWPARWRSAPRRRSPVRPSCGGSVRLAAAGPGT